MKQLFSHTVALAMVLGTVLFLAYLLAPQRVQFSNGDSSVQKESFRQTEIVSRREPARSGRPPEASGSHRPTVTESEE